MGIKFRKSIKLGPARINLSKSGVGYSVGGKGVRVTKKAGGGTRTTVGIPGTGISYSSDSKKKTTRKKASPSKTTVASRSSTSTTTTTSTASTASSTQTNGCLIGCLSFVLLIGAFIWACVNWKTLLGAAILAAAAYIGIIAYKIKRSQKPENPIATEDDPELEGVPLLEDKTTQQNEPEEKQAEPTQSAFEIRRTEKIKQFEAEMLQIPTIDIPRSEPAPRQLLKNMPEYSFSNITRRTRLDSIFPLVVLDVETTGFAPSKCEILEVSAIKFDTGMVPVCAFTTLCKPHKPIPDDASAVNHITEDMVADAPAFNQIAPALTDFLRGCHIAGHNLDFDLRFIYAHGTQLPENVRFYDTLDLAHLTIPQSSVYNYKLDTVCRYYGIWRDDAHRSLSDCYATSKIFSRLVYDKTSRQLVADTDSEAEIEKIQEDVPNPDTGL